MTKHYHNLNIFLIVVPTLTHFRARITYHSSLHHAMGLAPTDERLPSPKDGKATALMSYENYRYPRVRIAVMGNHPSSKSDLHYVGIWTLSDLLYSLAEALQPSRRFAQLVMME